MIIASPAKKEISIPLQPMPPGVSSAYKLDIYEQKQDTAAAAEQTKAIDIISINGRRSNGQNNDFIVQVFGQTSVFNAKVDEILTIVTTTTMNTMKGRDENHNKTMKTLSCEAFIHNNTVFLSSPFVGYNAGLLNWADGEFQTCVTHLLELAEEKTGCGALVISIDRRSYKKDALDTLLRALMYVGFELVDPSVYGQEPGYILIGYEL